MLKNKWTVVSIAVLVALVVGIWVFVSPSKADTPDKVVQKAVSDTMYASQWSVNHSQEGYEYLYGDQIEAQSGTGVNLLKKPPVVGDDPNRVYVSDEVGKNPWGGANFMTVCGAGRNNIYCMGSQIKTAADGQKQIAYGFGQATNYKQALKVTIQNTKTLRGDWKGYKADTQQTRFVIDPDNDWDVLLAYQD